jgi:hypothetical protein
MEENKIYNASVDADMEQRASIESLREDGRISKYSFRILVRDKADLVGTFTREEVDLIYRLYSSAGANLTQKVVSRHFPLYTFQEFKKILRAFNLTKASVPFAPHVIEEHTEDELVQLMNQQRENNFLKKYEQVKEQQITQKYQELLKTHQDLKNSVSSFEGFISEFPEIAKFSITPPKSYSRKTSTLIVYISDMHIGADVSKYSIYSNIYNAEEVNKRMLMVIERIHSMAKSLGISNIIITNIGDSLDGIDGQTTRKGHLLPQNLNNKDQFKTFLSSMVLLFSSLSSSGLFENISYIAVEGGNHK